MLAEFKKPGDYIDFGFYIINDGTIDAAIDRLEITGIDSSLENYFNNTIKYIDNTNVQTGDYLQAGGVRKIIVHIEYRYDVESFIPTNELSLAINFSFIQPKEVTTTEWDYEYIDQEQYFIVPKTGTYKLETWGAQGGNSADFIGGYGGYSTGQVEKAKGDILYINVGGAGGGGNTNKNYPGGYNGGGAKKHYYSEDSDKDLSGGRMPSSGGGATHVASASGILSSFLEPSNASKYVYIVSGGGGGATYQDEDTCGHGGSGGGYQANSGVPGDNCSIAIKGKRYGTGGSQTSGGTTYGCNYHDEDTFGTFGQGAIQTYDSLLPHNSGGGGGWFGGGADGCAGPGGGGSSYIGNSLLTNKAMYCYNCEESTEESTKTISTTNVSEIPTSQYAKIGNGYARITYLG